MVNFKTYYLFKMPELQPHRTINDFLIVQNYDFTFTQNKHYMPPPPNPFGIVYLLTNPSIPCLVKIGMPTRDNVESRMKELYETGVPAPFERQYACKVAFSDCATIEKALHTAFAPDRINANREFFRIQPEQAEAILALFHREDVTHNVNSEMQHDPTEEDFAASKKFKTHRPSLNFSEMKKKIKKNCWLKKRCVSLQKF